MRALTHSLNAEVFDWRRRAASLGAIGALAACAGRGSIPQAIGGSAPAARATARAATTLFVLNDGNNTVTIYKSPFSSNSAPVQTVKLNTPSGAIPEGIAISSSGTIFVANWLSDNNPHRAIGVYDPPYNQGRLVAKSVRAGAVAVDPSNDLIVGDDNGIEVYGYPYTNGPSSTFAGSEPQLDGHRHLFVKEFNSVDEFEAPYYTSPVRVFQSPFGTRPVQAIGVSPSGDLFVSASDYKKPIILYVPPYKNPPTRIPKDARGMATELSALSTGDLFALIGESSDFAVYEYVAPYQSRPAQIGPRQGNGEVLARDNQLFVAVYDGGVAVYASPFNGAPAEITNGVDNPGAIAVSP